MNNVDLVGRLVNNPEIKNKDNFKKCYITIAITRNFKNVNGEYETDFIDCILWHQIAVNTAEYCRKGDIVGIRGRLQTRNIELEDGTKYKKTEVIAERISFISSRKEEK